MCSVYTRTLHAKTRARTHPGDHVGSEALERALSLLLERRARALSFDTRAHTHVQRTCINIDVEK
jgi:hypothetical protein